MIFFNGTKSKFFSVRSKKYNRLYLRTEKELGAHIWWFCSTIKYFKTTKYEHPTPSQLGDRADCIFLAGQKKTTIWYD